MARGGGVFVSGSGSLSLTDTLIANNTAIGGFPGDNAAGGGVCASGASTVTITDCALSGNKATGATGAAGTKAGASGSAGGSASGGGLFVSGSGWAVTLKGAVLSSNSASGGAGGAGATGTAVITAAGVGKAGGAGGVGGNASGGGLFATGSGTLTILNDLTAPITHPSIMIDNTCTGGAGGLGGTGGAGGKVTGTGGTGGAGGTAGIAAGGALACSNAIGDTFTADIGNTACYHNTATGGGGGTGGAGGAGFKIGAIGLSHAGGDAKGGGLRCALAGGGVTVVNCTVAANTAAGGGGGSGASAGKATGGGICEADTTVDILDHNTITLNTATGTTVVGGGIAIVPSNPTLINNLLPGNTSSDLACTGTTPTALTNATNNFITVISNTTVNATTNHVGDATVQLASVVGVSVSDNAIGGPIYYPLLSGVYSIGAGTPGALNSITTVEATNLAIDEVGDLRTSNGTASGSISLGAVQPLVVGAPVATTIVPGNASINYYDATPSPAFTITAAVDTTTGGTASGGTLSIYLASDNNNPPTLLGMATVAANGISTVNVLPGAFPANLQVGRYDLVENFSGNADFDASNAIGTLTITAAPTTLVAGNANITPGSSSPFAISAEVNSPAGTVNSGTVTIDLVSDNTTTVLGTGTVSGGEAVVSVTNPAALAVIAALPAGKYDLEETYAGVTGGQFAGSGNTGTLTVDSPVTTTLPSSSLFPATGAITTSGGTTTIPVVVNCPGGVANGGTLTISLVNGGTTTVIGSATASNGVANVPVTIPAGLAPGTYTLVESYSGDAGCAPSSTTGTLTIQGLSPIMAALELAVDAAELVSMGNPGALQELALFSDVFLHQPLPMPSAPQLVHDIQSLFPQTGDMGFPALGTAMFLAQDLAAENPMS
jgi:hypothetical protein